MQIVRLIAGMILVYAWFILVIALFALLAGCAASGEMPLCENNCSMSKTWGVN